MSFILSDILPTMGHSQYAMMYGIVGAWLSSPRTFIGSWSVVGFPHCGIYPIAVLSHCGVLSAYCQVSHHRYYTPIVG